MIGFYLYIGFCLTTALTAVYELLMPVLRQRKYENKKTDNVSAIYIAFFFVTILAAPLAFIACVSPIKGIQFREYLEKGLFPTD